MKTLKYNNNNITKQMAIDVKEINNECQVII